MTDWTNPSQLPQSPQPNQPQTGQFAPQIHQPPTTNPGALSQPTTTGPFIPQQTPKDQLPAYQLPTTNPFTPPPPPMTTPLMPQQPPMTTPLAPQQTPMGQTLPYQPPIVQQQPPVQLSLRMRYTPEQIRLYFFPYPDRGPKIRELEQKIGALYKQMTGLAIGGLILFLLFIATARQGVSYLGLIAIAGTIGAIVLIYQCRKKLRPLKEELRRELDASRRETDHTNQVKPPNERQYDRWIDEISEELYKRAPARLRLNPHPEYIKWKESVASIPDIDWGKPPEEFGASLSLEGRISYAEEKEEQPTQLWKWTHHGSLRPKHYSVYVFTSLFIAPDYVAIYTATVNLREATRDREMLEYGYHKHLSHMSLNVDTTVQTVDTQPPTPIAFQETTLSLDFDSGTRIRRNVSTIHIGNEFVTNIDNIHEKLVKALIDHEMSLVKGIKESRAW